MATDADKVAELPEPPDRACPGCGYLVDQVRVDKAVLNFRCPRCGAFRLSEFYRVRIRA